MLNENEDTETREQVEDKLVELFANDRPNDLSRILIYIHNHGCFSREDDNIPTLSPVVRVLGKMINNEEAFVAHANALIEDTKIAEKNEEYYAVMLAMHSRMLDPDEDPFRNETEWDGLQIVAKNGNMQKGAVLLSLVRAWGKLPAATKAQMISKARNVVKVITSNKKALTVVDDVIGTFSKTHGNIIMVGLALAQLTWDAIQHIRAWYKGEISGKRCAKNVIDSFVTLASGIGGGIVGAVVGSALLPGWGTITGSVFGGFFSSAFAESVTDYFTCKVFGLPKSLAEENAYRFFGLESDASNSDINRAYYQLSRESHPDRSGGSHEAFLEVQVQLQIVRQSREATDQM